MTNYPNLHRIITYDELKGGQGRGFVADPFVADFDGRATIFFEKLSFDPLEKTISCSVRGDDGNWNWIGDVIEHPDLEFSFPFVFESNGVAYMIPEVSGKSGCDDVDLRLYRAEDYPTDWTVECKLPISGVDPVLFDYRNRWNLICNTNGALRLFTSQTLINGGWKEHPASPIEPDKSFGRMGGRPIISGDDLFLLYQNGSIHYGEMVHCCRVTEYGEKSFEQEEIAESPLACGQYTGSWNHLGMHHIDFNERFGIAIVDGHDESGWSIAKADISSAPKRLTPAPAEFSLRQRVSRKCAITKSKLDDLKKVQDYRAEHGTKQLLEKCLQKISP